MSQAPARHHQTLLIVDFGSQVTQLIARRLRELRVYCEIHPVQSVDAALLNDLEPRAIILSGGPASVLDPDAPLPPAEVFARGVPVLGICYGQQAMMAMLGGRVERGTTTREFGRAWVAPAPAGEAPAVGAPAAAGEAPAGGAPAPAGEALAVGASVGEAIGAADAEASEHGSPEGRGADAGTTAAGAPGLPAGEASGGAPTPLAAPGLPAGEAPQPPSAQTTQPPSPDALRTTADAPGLPDGEAPRSPQTAQPPSPAAGTDAPRTTGAAPGLPAGEAPGDRPTAPPPASDGTAHLGAARRTAETASDVPPPSTQAALPDILAGWFGAGREQVWMSHGDHVAALAPGFEVLATSPGAPFAITGDRARHLYAVQFHPEVHHTPAGATLLANFTRIAGFSGDWTMGAFREEAVARIRDQVGEARVICGLSGGVDSSVTAVLLHEAIGDRLTCVFVDHGLLRKDEAAEVTAMFRDHYNVPLIAAEEADRFLTALAGVTDPEAKRKTIGRLFIDVFQEHAGRIEGAEYLAQGTLYPDVIESVSVSGGPSVTIKSHHNVGGLPAAMGLKLVEPLRALFKDEVRTLGAELGLPASFIGRHPFPGPGLAIRCPGEVTAEKLAILREADAVYIDQIRRHGLYDEIWQAFVALLPVRSVGVMGDGRTYEHACALRAVTSVDGMTADVYPFPHDFLTETATRIVNEVAGINRVTYDITSKPPGTIEWE